MCIRDRTITISNAYSPTVEQPERMSLISLETITDTILELMEACMNDIPDCEWLAQWQELAKRFAFQFNPALQPRAIIVYGCISKTTSDGEIKALLRILVKALESFSDIDLIDSIIMCLTRLLPLLPVESKIHKFMFWIALSILQLEETQLYASGLALLEQNLHTLDHMLNLFENTPTHQQQTLERIMMDAREPLEWQFKQLDASMGLSFKSNFNFALVGHLIKGKLFAGSITEGIVVDRADFVAERFAQIDATGFTFVRSTSMLMNAEIVRHRHVDEIDSIETNRNARQTGRTVRTDERSELTEMIAVIVQRQTKPRRIQRRKSNGEARVVLTGRRNRLDFPIECRICGEKHFDGKTIFIFLLQSRMDPLSQGNDENEQKRCFDHG